MTNTEKFVEVFGFEPELHALIETNCIFPNTVCAKYKNCSRCPMEDWWDKEYKEEVQNVRVD